MSDTKTMVLLDELESMIENAQSPVLGSKDKRLVDANTVLELIDEIREELPPELLQAQQIVSERQHLMDDASKQAASMIDSAHERAQMLINEKEIVKLAHLQAKKIVSDANEIGDQTRISAENYASEIFDHVEQSLSVLLDHTEKCRARLGSE